jgi:hypothetical protein
MSARTNENSSPPQLFFPVWLRELFSPNNAAKQVIAELDATTAIGLSIELQRSLDNARMASVAGGLCTISGSTTWRILAIRERQPGFGAAAIPCQRPEYFARCDSVRIDESEYFLAMPDPE